MNTLKHLSIIILFLASCNFSRNEYKRVPPATSSYDYNIEVSNFLETATASFSLNFNHKRTILNVIDADCGSCFDQLFFWRDSLVNRLDTIDAGLVLILNTRDSIVLDYLLKQQDITFRSMIHFKPKSFREVKSGSIEGLEWIYTYGSCIVTDKERKIFFVGTAPEALNFVITSR